MVPAAPGRLTTTTGRGSVLFIDSASARATVSMAPPAGNGQMRVTGRSGYCAAARPASRRTPATAATDAKRRARIDEPPCRTSVSADSMRSAAVVLARGPEPGGVPPPPRAIFGHGARPRGGEPGNRPFPRADTVWHGRCSSRDAVAENATKRRVDAMPMETLLTLAIILGVPLWLAAEELLHRF